MPKWVDIRWQPDLDCSWEVAPGALTRCRGVVPTRKGVYSTFAVETEIASYTSSTIPLIGTITRKADGTARFFIFNKQSIYEFTDPSTGVDRSVGGGYSASTTDWTWTQFGDTTIATNYYNPVQYSSAGAFAGLAGSPPKAQLIASNMGFVMLANIDDGTAKPDGWACCDIEDITDWTPTATNQADSGRLYDTPGPIRALEPLRDSIVAYKDDSIYIAEYLGDLANGIIWQWRLISDKVGASSAHGVCRVNDAHYFIHRSGFYVFDGAAVRKIGRECTNFLFNTDYGLEVEPDTAQVCYDSTENIVCFTWAATAVFGRDAQAFYNVETGKWSNSFGYTFTLGTSAQMAAGESYSSGIVKASTSDMIAFDATIPTDTPSALLIGRLGSAISVYAFAYNAKGTETSVTVEIQTGGIGNGVDTLRLGCVRPRLTSFTVGTTPTATFFADNNEMNVTYNGSGPPETQDTSKTAEWSSTHLQFNGNVAGKFVGARMFYTDCEMEIGGIYLNLSAAGSR